MGELAVKVGGITGINLYKLVTEMDSQGEDACSTYHIGTEAWLVLPLQQLAPVNVGEEVVRLDLRSTICTQTVLRIAVEKPSEKIPSSRRNHLRTRE